MKGIEGGASKRRNGRGSRARWHGVASGGNEEETRRARVGVLKRFADLSAVINVFFC